MVVGAIRCPLRRLAPEQRSPHGVRRNAGLGAECRKVEEEAFARDQIVPERELDEHRQFRAPAIGHDVEPIAGHGHLHGSPADQALVVVRMSLQHDIVVGEGFEEAGQDLRVGRQALNPGAEGRALKHHVVVKQLDRGRHILPALRDRQCLRQFEHSPAVHARRSVHPGNRRCSLASIHIECNIQYVCNIRTLCLSQAI